MVHSQPLHPSGPGQVRECLEQQIRDGILRPGDRLDEQELCARFQVSRTPVREALLQLSMIKLVKLKPRQGAIVTQLTVREIAAMWEVLTAMEGLCAGLSARRITREELERLKGLHESARKCVQANDVDGYANANEQFHNAIYAASKNDYLSSQVGEIRSRLQAYRRLPFSRPGGMNRSFQGHDDVLAALSEGDSAAATKAMERHVASGMSFLDVIAELPDDSSPVEGANRPARPSAKLQSAGASRAAPRKGKQRMSSNAE